MEEAFEKLKKDGKNDVDSLIQWMKNSKVIDDVKASEEKARSLFQDVANKQCVELANFKEALAKLAAEQKKSLEDLSNSLVDQGPKFMNALMAGVSAFKEAVKKP
ncbi:uncharacterized protein LOC113523266 [Galleria mellonella]|uniref:Uncharacterized protein LOC113523266 n=1 Tax=Galleria mellonella TaxID=7137 RepID=A0A6J1X5Z0_GALME|nr:uncharacterized protein LOC113523266 [Galleria mellonella]